MSGWIGVDLDGTLAHYEGWQGIEHIGAPIPRMLERVRQWLQDGKEVKIFTARVGCQENEDPADSEAAREAIKAWCVEHIGHEIPITHKKDFGMIVLWDDRVVQVVPNTGETVGVVNLDTALELMQEWEHAMNDAHHYSGGDWDRVNEAKERLVEYIKRGNEED